MPSPWSTTGIEVAPTATAAVEGADVVITMLFDGAAVAEVMRETAPAMRPGAAWLQMTTVGPDDVAGLAAIAQSAGVLFYDSPVSGTRQPAESGTLVIMTAGPASGRELVTPVLDAVGSRTVWTGEDGAAATSTRLKLVVNSWVIAVSNAAGEIVTLAKAIGVPPAQFFEVLDGGGLDLPFLRIKADLVERGALSPANFAVDTSGKDAHLILELAREAGLRLDGMEAFSAPARPCRRGRPRPRGHGRLLPGWILDLNQNLIRDAAPGQGVQRWWVRGDGRDRGAGRMSQPDGDMGALHRPDRLRPAVPGGGVGAGPALGSHPSAGSCRTWTSHMKFWSLWSQRERVGVSEPRSQRRRAAAMLSRCPLPSRRADENDREGLSGSSQRVLDLRWGGVQDRPADESVPLESTQGDCEHALGDSLNRAQQLPEPAPAVQAQLNDDENRPGVPDPIEDVAQAADSAVGLAVAFL